MTIEEILSRLEGVKRNGEGWMARCPVHGDATPSLSIADKGGKIVMHCFTLCSNVDILRKIGLEMRDLFPDTQAPTVRHRSNGSTPTPKAAKGRDCRKLILKAYQYTDASGEVLYENVRYRFEDDLPDEKRFFQRRPNGNGGYIGNLHGVTRLPYNLPDLIVATEAGAKQIFLCEGEKDADSVKSLGLTATNLKNWRRDFNQYLGDAQIVIIRDHDKPGVKLADRAAGIVSKEIDAVKIVDPFNEEPMADDHGKDISDWIEARRREGLDDDTIAKRLESLVDDVDTKQDEVDETLTSNGSGHDTGSSISPSILDVCGADLLDEIESFIGRFVSYPSVAARVAHVLWIAHTWLMDHWDSTPRLAALSPEPGSGKSRLLEVTEPLVPRAIHAVNTTPAYLFRKVSDPDGPPTILYDEIDTVFGPKAVGNEDIRGMLNAGHRRGATAGRCVTRGRIIETEELPAYCAVALAGLNDLPETLMTRSIIIRMRRRAPNEKTEPWRQRRNGEEAKRIAERLAAWARSITSVSFAEPPTGIEDRNADVWEPLLTVAALAGGKWPEKAEVAAVALVASAAERKKSLGVQLLADLRTIFEAERRLGTEAIIQKLCALPESPWCDLRGKPLDARSLREHLRPYDIKPKQLREGERNIRGYERSDCEDAWSRYLPDEKL